VSQDARNHGGRIPLNLAEALRTGAMTPEQALRKALESDENDTGALNGFEAAVQALSGALLVDDVYFVMAGEGAADAAVVTRVRNGALDVWRLGTDAACGPGCDPATAPSDDFFLGETNYDHWKPVPAADNRREPANAHMAAVGSPAMSHKGGLERPWCREARRSQTL